jgi:hypothetical protein
MTADFVAGSPHLLDLQPFALRAGRIRDRPVVRDKNGVVPARLKATRRVAE